MPRLKKKPVVVPRLNEFQSSCSSPTLAPQKKNVLAAPAAIPSVTPISEPLLLDIKSAARLISSTPWTIRHLLWAKKIPFVKIGRRFLIDPADLRAYIAKLKAA